MLNQPQLIVPNVLDTLRSEGDPIAEDEFLMGVFTNRRWLWLMEPGDAIILPEKPPKAFIDYLAALQHFDPEQFHIIVLKKDPRFVVSEALHETSLLSHLKKIVNPSWTIVPFLYTPDIINLAEELGISLPSKWKTLVRQNFCFRMNCKSYFRQLGIVHDLPLPEGEVCKSERQLINALNRLLSKNGQVIVKHDFNAGGAGNIGLSADPNSVFTGIKRQLTLGNLEKIAHALWTTHTGIGNNQLIVEVYHPNQGVFTCDVFVPYEKGDVRLVNYAEMRMDRHWIGGEIPATRLDRSLTDRFISYTLQLGQHMQKEGYFGYMCSDIILTGPNQFLFTEINVRQSGFLHVDTLARRLFGDDYMKQVVLLIRKDVEIESFEKTYSILDKAGLLFAHDKRNGVVFLTLYGSQAEFLIIAQDSSSAYELESCLLKSIS